MNVELTIKNYRSFSEKVPAIISIKDGITGFIGINNSGKSSILKFFYEFRDVFSRLTDYSIFHNSLRGLNAFNYPSTIYDVPEVFHNKNKDDIVIDIKTEVPLLANSCEAVLRITIKKDSNNFLCQFLIDNEPIVPDAVRLTPGQISLPTKSLDLTIYYEIFRQLSNTLYIGPFRNALNLGDQPSYYDINVGQSFIKLWRRVKEGKSKRENTSAIKITEVIRSIFGYKSLEINPAEGDETLNVNIDGESFKLPELGAGITQFIVVLINAAIKTPAFLLIDEPELNLHPSLQLDFLTNLASYTSNGVLFATHSMGLVRSASDVIYSVSKNKDGESVVKLFEDTPNLPEFIGELNFPGNKELGCDRILLVEGKHEIKTFQQFLRFFHTEHQVAIIPLSGGDLINGNSIETLREIKRITTNIFAIIDSEKESAEAKLDKNREEFVNNCKELDILCHVLEKRATENYFADRAIKKIKGDKYKALESYQARKDLDPIWGKHENWRIAREMTKEEILATDLGKFIKNQVSK